MVKKHETPDQYPALGRALSWLDHKNASSRIFAMLCISCATLFVADFIYHKKTYMAVESLTGFYALCGFFMSIGLVLGAHILRKLVKRDATYYAPYDTQAEKHPDMDLDRKTIHD